MQAVFWRQKPAVSYDSVKNTVEEDGLGGSSGCWDLTLAKRIYSLADVIVLKVCKGSNAAGSIVAGVSGAANLTTAKIQRSVPCATVKLQKYSTFTPASIVAFLEWPYDKFLGKPVLIKKSRACTEIGSPVIPALHDDDVGASQPAAELFLSSSVSLSAPVVRPAAFDRCRVDTPSAVQLFEAPAPSPLLDVSPALSPVLSPMPVSPVSASCNPRSFLLNSPADPLQRFALESSARLRPDTSPSSRNYHANGENIVDVVGFDQSTELYTIQPLIGLARRRTGIPEWRLETYCSDGLSALTRNGLMSAVAKKRVIVAEGQVTESLKALEHERKRTAREMVRVRAQSAHELAVMEQAMKVREQLAAKSLKRTLNEMVVLRSSASKSAARAQAKSARDILDLQHTVAQKSKTIKVSNNTFRRILRQKEARAIIAGFHVADTTRCLELAQRANVSLSRKLVYADQEVLDTEAQTEHM